MNFNTSIDYLTVTFRCMREWEASVKRVENLADWGGKRRPWFFYGYSGFSTVTPEGHLATGRGTRGGIVQSSGAISNLLSREHARWEGPGLKPTRVDLAVTFTLLQPIELVRKALEHQQDDWTMIVPSKKSGGGTLYVGSRKSSTFGRVYDKGAELNLRLPLGSQIAVNYLWRAEVEYKQAHARAVWSEVNKNSDEGNLRDFVADTVITWFASRGVGLPISPNASSVVSVASRAVDDICTLKWLHEQVRPAIWRLAENGKITDVAQALNVQPRNFALDPPRYLEENFNQFSFFDKLS